jgi:uncharacterized protein YqhQ
MSTNPTLPYGGQAVIEGVMMRGVGAMAVAVRAPDQRIVLHTQPLNAANRGRLSKMPFVRGLLGLWDALALGWQSLSFSANVAGGEEVKFEGPAAWGTLAVSIAFGVGLFFLTPAAVAQLGEAALGGVGPWFGSLLEGVIRLGLIVAYLWAISLLPDIRRLFGYHGAEHKTINAFEAGAALTPDSVARFPLEHPRCGTAFLLTVVVFSILLFALLGPLPVWARLVTRVLLIPVVAGVAFEYIRFTARHLANPLVRLLVIPNLALQRLTTREPDANMLEVAIAAFNAMREKEVLVVT